MNGELADEDDLIRAAQQGDSDAYGRLMAVYHGELHAHCYRMLGSPADADDALQEALVRAWRGMRRFERRGSLRAWLYAIATNACLKVLQHRPGRILPVDYGPAADPHQGLGSPPAEPVWIGPDADQLESSADSAATPEARYDQRESVELAFIAALQYLTPSQRHRQCDYPVDALWRVHACTGRELGHRGDLCASTARKQCADPVAARQAADHGSTRGAASRQPLMSSHDGTGRRPG